MRCIKHRRNTVKVKVKSKPRLPKGKKERIVYCSYRDGEVIVARRYVYPKLSGQNSSFASRNTNLFRLNPSEGYRNDCREYIHTYNATPNGQESPIRSWNNLYIKLMSALARNDPELDLRTLTREEIYAHQLPCISIKSAVEAGLLPKVKHWEQLVNEL